MSSIIYIIIAIVAIVLFCMFVMPTSIKESKVKIVIEGGNSDAPVQELRYFCVKDKGDHVIVWPKDYHSLDIVRFYIAGIEYRHNINSYLCEFKGTLEAEPTNPYDKNAIKVLAPDGHHVGYVPKDMTAEVRKVANLPCPCFFYIGKRNGIYFSDCYITRNPPPNCFTFYMKEIAKPP